MTQTNIDGIMVDYREKDNILLSDCSKLSEILKVPLFYLRQPKKHGLENTIEGDLNVLKSCKNVVMVRRFER